MITHALVHTPIGDISFRDAALEDSQLYSSYWCNSTDRYLEQLGVSRHRLGTKEEIEERFVNMIRNGDPAQNKVIFTFTLNDQAIGYVNLNRYQHLSESFAHIHSYFPQLKRALKQSRSNRAESTKVDIGKVVVGIAIKSMLNLFPSEPIIAQTRVSNTKINNVLDHYKSSGEGIFFDKPDGLSNPGEFYMRYFYQEDIAQLQATSEAHAGS